MLLSLWCNKGSFLTHSLCLLLSLSLCYWCFFRMGCCMCKYDWLTNVNVCVTVTGMCCPLVVFCVLCFFFVDPPAPLTPSTFPFSAALLFVFVPGRRGGWVGVYCGVRVSLSGQQGRLLLGVRRLLFHPDGRAGGAEGARGRVLGGWSMVGRGGAQGDRKSTRLNSSHL